MNRFNSFNIGDEVIMNKDLIIKGFSGTPPWLSNEIFIIKKIVRENNNNQVVQLDRDLYYNDGVIRV